MPTDQELAVMINIYEKQLPSGWKIGSVMTNDIEWSIFVFNPALPMSPDSLKEGRGPTVELAFRAALNQVSGGSVH
jgi:hypothetical protein